MSYRNDKRRTAIWILKQLCKPSKMTITGIQHPDRHEEINERHYDTISLKDLISQSNYSRELLRDAADLLFLNKHIDLFENQKDRFDIKIKAFKQGEFALREDFYQDQIDDYNSDKYYRNLRMIIPILALLISIVSLFISTCKKSEIIIQMMPQKNQQAITK